MKPSRNIFGATLVPCSPKDAKTKTGYFRNGCCDTDITDRGQHTVCVEVTAEFLAFSRSVGNDLSTPAPEYGFAGLVPGDKWCLCAARWKQAYEAGVAPRVFVTATHQETLTLIPIEHLTAHAIDLN